MLRRGKDFIEKLPDGKIAAFLFITALIVRALYALFFYFSQPIPETNLYYELAQDIIAQGRMFYDTSHPYYEFPGPGLPWLNALTMLLFGKNYLGLYLVTALGSALITFFTFKTARLFLDKTTSLLIGIWSAFYLFYFYYTPSPGKDIWMAFFMICLIYQLLKLFPYGQFSYPRFLLFTLTFVFSFHLDERFFVFAPFLFLYILFYETQGFKKFRFIRSLLFSLLIILFMAPWTIRNYNKHNKIVTHLHQNGSLYRQVLRV
jgi:4-amino-4-deoxy-L-arabinose transferase-like glycosyltransferase